MYTAPLTSVFLWKIWLTIPERGQQVCLQGINFDKLYRGLEGNA